MYLLPGGSALDAGFVYDDKVEVVGNHALRVFENWRGILSANVARPLLMLSYAFDWSRGGLDPRPYHETGLLIHLLTLLPALSLAVGLARRAGLDAPLTRAGIAVGLWAIHPMAVEAVAYVSGRSEALCALFVLTALAAWLKGVEADHGGAGPAAGVAWRAAGLLSAAAAVAVKEVGVVAPVAAFGLELALGRRPLGLRWAWALGLVGAGAWVLGTRWAAGVPIVPAEVERPLGAQLASSGWVLVRYVQLWAVPLGQTLVHDQAEIAPLSARGLGGLIGVLGWVGLAVGLARRGRVAAAWALICGLLFLLPSTSLPRLKELMAEHRAYQTGLWLSLAVALAAPRAPRPAALGAFAALGLALAAGTAARLRVWQSEVSLFAEAAARSPRSVDAAYGHADALRFAGDCTAAIPGYERVLELEPRHLDAWNNLGICKAQLGDEDGAIAAWLGALRERPSYCKAHTNLGSLHYRRRRWEQALVELRSALAYCPDNTVAHWLAGSVYYGPLRDPKRALVHYERILELDPRFDHAEEVKRRVLELTW